MPSKKNDIYIYLFKLSKDIQLALDRVRQTVMVVVPEAEQTINYGMPTIRYRYQGLMLVGFDVFKNHCSFFPCSSSTITLFTNELKKSVTTKVSIHFTVEKPLPLALITKITKHRVQKNEVKALAKRKK